MSTTYKTRPVFDFPLSWSEDISASISYDLREIRTPFGPVVFRPSQRYEFQGWEIEWHLEGADQVAAWDTFEGIIQGSLNGFWFPEPEAIGEVADQTLYSWSSPADDNKILIADTGLSDRLAELPALHVQFWLAGQTPVYAEILSITSGPTGYEIATLDIARPAINPDWMMRRLIYGNFGSDETEREVARPEYLRLSQRVVELPTEYADLETGALKVWFYRFFYGGPGTAISMSNDWLYTSLAADVSTTYGGAISSTSHASQPLEHGEIKFDAKTLGASCTIKAPLVTGGPFERLIPVQAGEQLWVQIRWADYATPNSTTLVYTGELEDVQAEGPDLSLRFNNGKAFKRTAPNLRRQTWCGYRFGDPATCKATVPSAAVTVSAISGRTVTVTGTLDTTTSFYAGGLLDAGSGRTREVIAVRQSEDAGGGAVLLTLARTPRYATSTTGTLKRGCRKTQEDCITYQGDLVNNGGFQWIPQSNPTITPQTSAPGPNKK